ncbi:hypothetical protein CGRA01v4_08144 [Colletotrichum graminicola]|uniref:Zn(2)-C6 fungal-type domain-containing protein n=1 Tax=Colletotrichum graminicola (strain M1.001 / M2 / FGSC 10212) TaxID=645133 RepID=E3QV80_COLGM|nr:uncharacterized protein GLRG_09914 [Colletotrichum graminicola M1.001]EFQ34770.1 hypothetical protein GLRG_09914 [Colletotrichum graminicola M1.001]WDK16861.1 hypothetical protein CGRA01v4_08144 [Colletotrichum graminicola]
MARITKQKACIACTESKRRCDKGAPSCSRCDDRDIDCRYPATQRRRHLQRQGPFPDPPAQQPDLNMMADTLIIDAASLATGAWSMPWTGLDFAPSPQAASGFAAPQLLPARSPPQPTTQTHIPQHAKKPVASSLAESKWFLAPSTWRIDHCPTPPQDSYPVAVMTNFNRGQQAWVRRWVMEGHNPFIHRSLYVDSGHFSTCIQDAFTAASAYYAKTPQNETFVYRILDERAAALVASQPAVSLDGTPSATMLETKDHLARVHALYVYTVIRLYDGSVSQRAAAEDLLPTLDLWCKQLWESALADVDSISQARMPRSSEFYSNNSSLSASQEVATSAAAVAAAAATEDSSDQHARQDTFETDLMAWKLWVLSESIRRTWIIVSCAIGVYYALKGRWGECAGFAQFTARAGLWDATSAPQWAAMRRKDLARKDGGEPDFFIPSVHAESLLREMAAAEVDEFTRHLLTSLWGIDRVEDWALRTSSKGKVSLIY